jgi:rhodanese-related sulfurtransferase
MHFKLIYDKSDGRVLGAQAIGKGNVDKRIDVIATAIKFNATITDLCDLELCYAPPFGTAKDVVNMAAYVASNLNAGKFKQVTASKVRELVNANAYILDVREEVELARGTIKGSINIPLSQLRDRLAEIPKNRAIYVHCRSGQRSYNATLVLQQHGFNDVYNLAGGFLALSYYEYYNDITTGRKAILTAYNFN